MSDIEKYLDLQRAATTHYRASENTQGIQIQSQLVEDMLSLGPEAIHNQPRIEALLKDVSSQLVDTLRWEGMYQPAITLQERLEGFLPESLDLLRMGAANLRIEGGEEEAGLNQLRILTENDPDNLWIWISLGAGYLWLARYAEAEPIFKHAAGLTNARKVDRAVAQKYLYELYAAQEGRTADALAAWREGYRLDAKMRQMLPEVIRMLIYWREFDQANQMCAKESDRVRKLFYQGLVLADFGNMKEASGFWRTILLDIPSVGLHAGQDEYAEACIRLVNPSMAIPVLEPLVQADQLNYFRLVILGLAWAQKQSTERAAWYLRHALRVGDLARPRKTRPAPQGRILDIYARLLYYDIIVNPEVRAALDVFFIPSKDQA